MRTWRQRHEGTNRTKGRNEGTKERMLEISGPSASARQRHRSEPGRGPRCMRSRRRAHHPFCTPLHAVLPRLGPRTHPPLQQKPDPSSTDRLLLVSQHLLLHLGRVQLPDADARAVRPARGEADAEHWRVAGEVDVTRLRFVAAEGGVEGGVVRGCCGVSVEGLEEEPEELAGGGEGGERIPAVTFAANAVNDRSRRFN